METLRLTVEGFEKNQHDFPTRFITFDPAFAAKLELYTKGKNHNKRERSRETGLKRESYEIVFIIT